MLGIVYSVPPLRIKDKKQGWLVNAICAEIVFLQAYFALGGIINSTIFMLLVIIALFITYIENFHILVDYQIGERIIERKKVMKRLNTIPAISVVVSLLFSIIN